MVRAVFGSLPFWIIFLMLESLRNTTQLACALLNSSVIVQLSIILNLEWTSRYSDKVWTLTSSKIKLPVRLHIYSNLLYLYFGQNSIESNHEIKSIIGNCDGIFNIFLTSNPYCYNSRLFAGELHNNHAEG